MREILFRGKRVDNGEWVIGDGIHYPKSVNYKGTCWIDGMHEKANDWVQVIPETVGQYIGQIDKNGKKFFEGDIIENTPSWRRQRELLVILFKETSFCTIDCESFRKNKLAYAYPIDDCDYGVYINMFEVVGNIHDNPELIGGTE